MNPKSSEPLNSSKSFLDPRTILAFALTVLFFVGWHWYMEKKYPAASAAPTAVVAGANPDQVPSAPNASSSKQLAPSAAMEPAPSQFASAEETTLEFDSPEWAFRVSSRGMGLRHIDVKRYKSRAGEPIILGALVEKLPFSTELAETGKPIDFVLERASDREFVGRASVGGAEIVKTMRVDPSLYAIDVRVEVKTPGAEFKGLKTIVSDALEEPKPSSFFAPSYDRQDVFFRHDGGKTSRTTLDKHNGFDVAERNVSLVALSSHYFSIAAVDLTALVPRLKASAPANAAAAVAELFYEPVNRSESFEARFKGYAGPKAFETMDKVDPQLSSVIDYGMFGALGKPLWQLLKYCYSLVGNYGVAIILLTLIVRLCVLPFNVYSFKAMKAMQRIQPQINALKERYKDDPRAMNSEVMALMKANKANPLGGCLPVLLQLPVFFALYQVLGQSIELYRAPFAFWIQDLSAADRYYVLPVLMAGAMFMQQKLTPTAMDPAQARIMMWMPLIFAFFMLSLPSGLTLYILVSTIFGIVQQLVLSRDSKAGGAPAVAKAQPAK